jgi:transposase
MAALSIADVPAKVTIGVDTNKHSHIARAKDGLGRHLGQLEIETDPRGYAGLLAWAQEFGPVVTFGIEGTSSYGAGLTRLLLAQGQAVIEVLRPVRRDRRFGGKSDPIDADAAAGAVLSGKATAVPKAGDAGVEMVRALKIAKQTAIKARTQAVNAVKGLIVMAPDPIREQLRNLKTPALVRTCSAYRVDGASDPTSAIKLSLRSMCRRYVVLDQEVRSLEEELDALTIRLVPQLRQLFGVGQDVAATLVLAAGNSGDRLRSEASFSMLCGASPIPASSGMVQRHRLNRGGDRQANAALHQIVVVRLRYNEATRAYFAKRKAKGKSKKEIFRCLKRYVAREVYRTLVDPRDEAVRSAA